MGTYIRCAAGEVGFYPCLIIEITFVVAVGVTPRYRCWLQIALRVPQNASMQIVAV